MHERYGSYSRIREDPPGGEATLRRFGSPSSRDQENIAQMPAALREWGAVKSVEFASGTGQPKSSVDVRWDLYEVQHEQRTSLWRVAIDRDGTIWSVHVGPAPPNH